MLQTVVTVVAFIEFLDGTSDRLENWTNRNWDKAYRDNPEQLRRLQNDLECCGFYNVTDRAIPKYPRDACSKKLGYESSCFSLIQDSYRENHGRLAWFSLAATLAEVYPILLSP